MPAIPESTKISLAQRLREHVEKNWSQLAAVHVRYRGEFAYVTAERTDGDQVPLMRLRYAGPDLRWGIAVHVAGTNTYANQLFFSDSTEDAFDSVCGLHISRS
ncbi:PH domain-containing protein [Actinoplanes palleronii]|uniref:Low molecular weight protein antigen 6 PH domain-containing protein n=1 Tax=Actinoplanes palleronii TaxID=113570 RepID=A0ABQ4BP22_9ACTN|nr:hypothetical protein [Actinoplanes palleronii]GIE72411.1 hypothetical protein Apa02nite_085190 [Actinoplanes palleronii]